LPCSHRGNAFYGSVVRTKSGWRGIRPPKYRPSSARKIQYCFVNSYVTA
jgi:hypothetical protein